MLDKTAIYHKSAKGAEALASRGIALSPKLRSMLILCNGKRRVDELLRLGEGLREPEWLLEQLEFDGYIEPGPMREGPPSTPAPLFTPSSPAPLAAAPPAGPPEAFTGETFVVSSPAPLGGSAPVVPLTQAQEFAVRRLLDLLGPAADDLCGTIEAARTAPEFRAALGQTERILRTFVGPELAAQFVNEVETQRAW